MINKGIEERESKLKEWINKGNMLGILPTALEMQNLWEEYGICILFSRIGGRKIISGLGLEE